MSVHDSRLTDSDVAALRTALDEFLSRLREGIRPTPWDVHAQLSASHVSDTARRVMAHSIGCGLVDLRAAEIDVIDALIAERRDGAQ